MSAVVTCMAVALLGIDYGYEPSSDGGTEYIIQIEPGVFRSFAPDDVITSEIPREAGEVRRFRIQVGTQKLPRTAPKPSAAARPGAKGGTAEAAARPPLMNPWGALAPPSPAAQGPALVPPGTLPPIAGSKPMAERQALYMEPTAEAKTAEAKKPPAAAPATEAAKPWTLFWTVLLGFFASVTGNVYLGWIFLETRSRYRTALSRADEPQSQGA